MILPESSLVSFISFDDAYNPASGTFDAISLNPDNAEQRRLEYVHNTFEYVLIRSMNQPIKLTLLLSGS
jgi:hypothetical protein